ncbi:MAG TPA: hypothetical protein PLX15_02005 [Candidatus Woesearchaeota archaeon]|nr:hypothetical protein [Candidatus Woesearchaeota archaeon]
MKRNKKNKMFWLIFIFLISASLTSYLFENIFNKDKSNSNSIFNTSDNMSNRFEEKQIVLGYCPTMGELAKEIELKNEFVKIKPYESSAKGLKDLNNEMIDAVLVGRVAENSEIKNEVFEKRLREGFTLIGSEKRMINVDEIKNENIHTFENESIVIEYLEDYDSSVLKKVVFYNSFEEAVNARINGIVFISWNDFRDDYSLVIPVDEKGNKIERFRIPIIYSFDESIIEELKV